MQIEDLALEFINKPQTLILVVLAGNVDVSNSRAMKLAQEVDPEGKRTIGRPIYIVSTYKYTNKHTHTHIQTHTHAHIHTHIHTYIHTYIHTHTYMYAKSNVHNTLKYAC